MVNQLTLYVGTPSTHSASSLRLWVAADPPLRDQAKTGWGSDEPASGRDDLGDPLSILSIVLSSALALPAFIDSVRRWLGTQPPTETPVTLLRHGDCTVTLSRGASPETVAALAAALSASAGPTDPSGNSTTPSAP